MRIRSFKKCQKILIIKSNEKQLNIQLCIQGYHNYVKYFKKWFSNF